MGSWRSVTDLRWIFTLDCCPACYGTLSSRAEFRCQLCVALVKQLFANSCGSRRLICRGDLGLFSFFLKCSNFLVFPAVHSFVCRSSACRFFCRVNPAQSPTNSSELNPSKLTARQCLSTSILCQLDKTMVLVPALILSSQLVAYF